MKKRLLIAFALLVFLSTYKNQKLPLNILNIKEITVENNIIIKDYEVKEALSFVYNSNIFFLNDTQIKNALKKINFIDSYKIKKIYPDKLIIQIFEKKLIAILHQKKKKFYITDRIQLVNFKKLKDYQNLPVVFGNENNFKDLYLNLKKINFPINLIKTYYLLESQRWDLETNEKKIIKLSSKNYVQSLKNFMTLRKESNFNRYKVFDYRINNQLILK